MYSVLKSSVITRPDLLTRIILLHAHLKVVYYNCSVKFYEYPRIWLGRIVLTRNMDKQADEVIPIYPLKLCLLGYKQIIFMWQ